jgi:predicted transcriptional regulator
MSKEDRAKKKGWNWAPVPAKVFLSEELSHADVRVYAYLLWRTGEDDRSWPGVDTIAQDVHISAPAVKRSLKALIENDWIFRKRRVGHSSFTYIFESQEDCIAMKSKPDEVRCITGDTANVSQVIRHGITGDTANVSPEIRINESQVNENQFNESQEGASAQPPAAPSEITPSGEERPACADGPAGKKTRSKDESLRIQACPSGELLWVELDYSAQAEGRRPPEYYESAQQRDGFLAIFAALGDELPSLVKKALKQGIKSRARLLSWLEGCAAKRKAQLAPAPSPDDFMTRLAADQATARERVRLAKERTAARLQKEREQHAETV